MGRKHSRKRRKCIVTSNSRQQNEWRAKLTLVLERVDFVVKGCLPNNKILDWFKLKAFSKRQKVLSQKLRFDLRIVENIMGKGENGEIVHTLIIRFVNPLPRQILDSSKLKEFADDKWQKVIQTGRKQCGKRRNCSLRAISPFPAVFSKGLFPRGVKRCHCVGIG